MADRLYLLNADWFDDQGGPWYCPPGARIEGVLGLYPRLREQVQVTHLDHPRPRAAVVAEVGEANQSCPILVLDGEFDWPDAQVSERAWRKGCRRGHRSGNSRAWAWASSPRPDGSG